MRIQEREIEMIKDNDKMKKWTDNNIGDEGARMISESLKTNTTLTKLNLSGNEKWSKMIWMVTIIKKTKECKNEIKNKNDNEYSEERWKSINDNW